MSQDSSQENTNTVNPEVVADLTDQTLADDGAEEVGLAGETASPGDAASLLAQLEAANRRADDEHEAFLRARADFQNYKRRTEEDKESLRQYLSEDLLKRLLPIADNFERALQAASQTQDYDKLVAGVNAVYRQVQDFLAREGVTPIEALYEPFDPNFHNAVLREETTEYPENTVTEELQKGYSLQGRVLRPTLVKVATGAE
jgi:molecular chaperone GrpE